MRAKGRQILQWHPLEPAPRCTARTGLGGAGNWVREANEFRMERGGRWLRLAVFGYGIWEWGEYISGGGASRLEKDSVYVSVAMAE